MTTDQINYLTLIRDKLEMLGDHALANNEMEAHDRISCAFHEIAGLVGYPEPAED